MGVKFYSFLEEFWHDFLSWSPLRSGLGDVMQTEMDIDALGVFFVYVNHLYELRASCSLTDTFSFCRVLRYIELAGKLRLVEVFKG
jgi:hypothetical protein